MISFIYFLKSAINDRTISSVTRKKFITFDPSPRPTESNSYSLAGRPTRIWETRFSSFLKNSSGIFLNIVVSSLYE